MAVEYEWTFQASPELEHTLRALFPNACHCIQMETTYYDTPEHALASRRYTLRQRLENGLSIYTLKTPGLDGMRGEWEVAHESLASAVSELCKLGAPNEILLFSQKGFIPVCSARFTRLAWPVIQEDFQAEVAFDRGILLGGTRQLPLCELEIEYKGGSKEAFDEYVTHLSRQFHLQPESKSKFARAMALCREDVP